MNSEDKLKEYIEKTFAIPKEGISSGDREAMTKLYTIIKQPLLNILDEAKAEFPCGRCPLNKADDDNCLNYCSGRYGQFFEWFKKWFGEP